MKEVTMPYGAGSMVISLDNSELGIETRIGKIIGVQVFMTLEEAKKFYDILTELGINSL